jgi:hypothetical protein
MGRGEDAYELVFNEQGDGDFREGGLLAGEIVGVFANVGGVSHMAGEGDVSDQTFLAQLQAVAPLVHGAAMDTSQYELFAIGLVEVDVRFEESEGARYFVYDAVDQLIEIEKGADPVRGSLQPEQILREISRL